MEYPGGWTWSQNCSIILSVTLMMRPNATLANLQENTKLGGIDMGLSETSSVQDESKTYKCQNRIPQNSDAERTCIWNHRSCLMPLNKPTKSIGWGNNKSVEKGKST